MYLVDFLKRMTRKSNIPVIIYLILNVFVIAEIISLLFSDSGIQFPLAFLIGIVLYAISLTIALSPIGEWILRFQTDCTKIDQEEQANFIEPIYREVYDKAKQLDPSIPDDVKLFMNYDEVPNAFATGRKTVCVTKGMFEVPENQLKAALAHEFGHLSHKDTDLILVVSVGNLIVTALIIGIRIIIEIIHIFCNIIASLIGGTEGLIGAIFETAYTMAISLIVAGLAQIWADIGNLLVMKSCRANEYEADEFAYELGFGKELCTLLDTVDGSGASGLFATLASSHPKKDDRIARLQALGVTHETTDETSNEMPNETLN